MDAAAGTTDHAFPPLAASVDAALGPSRNVDGGGTPSPVTHFQRRRDYIDLYDIALDVSDGAGGLCMVDLLRRLPRRRDWQWSHGWSSNYSGYRGEFSDPPAWPGWGHRRLYWVQSVRRWDKVSDLPVNRRAEKVLRALGWETDFEHIPESVPSSSVYLDVILEAALTEQHRRMDESLAQFAVHDFGHAASFGVQIPDAFKATLMKEGAGLNDQNMQNLATLLQDKEDDPVAVAGALGRLDVRSDRIAAFTETATTAHETYVSTSEDLAEDEEALDDEELANELETWKENKEYKATGQKIVTFRKARSLTPECLRLRQLVDYFNEECLLSFITTSVVHSVTDQNQMIDLQHVNFLTIPTGEAILDIGATQDLIGETALRSVEMHFDFPVPEELATKYNLDKGAFQYMLSPSPYEKGGSDTNLRPTNMTKFASATTFEHEPNERDSRLTCSIAFMGNRATQPSQFEFANFPRHGDGSRSTQGTSPASLLHWLTLVESLFGGMEENTRNFRQLIRCKKRTKSLASNHKKYIEADSQAPDAVSGQAKAPPTGAASSVDHQGYINAPSTLLASTTPEAAQVSNQAMAATQNQGLLMWDFSLEAIDEQIEEENYFGLEHPAGVHINCGHPDRARMLRAFRAAGALPHILKYIREEFACEACNLEEGADHRRRAQLPRSFNKAVAIDYLYITFGEIQVPILNMVCIGTSYQVAERAPHNGSQGGELLAEDELALHGVHDAYNDPTEVDEAAGEYRRRRINIELQIELHKTRFQKVFYQQPILRTHTQNHDQDLEALCTRLSMTVSLKDMSEEDKRLFEVSDETEWPQPELHSWKAKSRWCIHGHVDPDTGTLCTYSPTPQSEGLMMFLQVYNMKFAFADVKNTFCQSRKLKRPRGPIFAEPCEEIHLPPGIAVEVDDFILAADPRHYEWLKQAKYILEQIHPLALGKGRRGINVNGANQVDLKGFLKTRLKVPGWSLQPKGFHKAGLLFGRRQSLGAPAS
ncbi:unnamed protein product [Durusdinium trenchii]|uniref:Uncharacterized protein n=1 Tax=Durusdinium trenchii TaxID=1381693 RepID=A0ABP0RJ79_9DINO